MLLLVQVYVKPEFLGAFQIATRANIEASCREPGVSRFELFQQDDTPAHFIILEEYRTPEAALSHKETAHYKLWRDTVAEMMACPRVGTRFSPVPRND